MPNVPNYATTNPYARGLSNNVFGQSNDQAFLSDFGDKPVFTGSDIHAYINNVFVGNLESVTYSTQREIVGIYGMGFASPLGFAKGKRMIVGSMMFAQFNGHALMEGVFQLASQKANSVGDLWSLINGQPASSQLNNNSTTNLSALGQQYGSAGQTFTIANSTAASTTSPVPGGSYSANTFTTSSVFGSVSDFDNVSSTGDMARALQIVKQQQLLYPDQLPPFDLTLVAVDEVGRIAKAAILGMQVSQETGGWSLADTMSNLGLSFVARSILYFRPGNVA